jgi:hypothetical protein
MSTVLGISKICDELKEVLIKNEIKVSHLDYVLQELRKAVLGSTYVQK